MRLVGLKLASLLARNVIDSQVTIFGLVAHNLLAHNLQIVALQHANLLACTLAVLVTLFCGFCSAVFFHYYYYLT